MMPKQWTPHVLYLPRDKVMSFSCPTSSIKHLLILLSCSSLSFLSLNNWWTLKMTWAVQSCLFSLLIKKRLLRNQSYDYYSVTRGEGAGGGRGKSVNLFTLPISHGTSWITHVFLSYSFSPSFVPVGIGLYQSQVIKVTGYNWFECLLFSGRIHPEPSPVVKITNLYLRCRQIRLTLNYFMRLNPKGRHAISLSFIIEKWPLHLYLCIVCGLSICLFYHKTWGPLSFYNYGIIPMRWIVWLTSFKL